MQPVRFTFHNSYVSACVQCSVFLDRVQLRTQKLFRQGYVAPRVKSSLNWLIVTKYQFFKCQYCFPLYVDFFLLSSTTHKTTICTLREHPRSPSVFCFVSITYPFRFLSFCWPSSFCLLFPMLPLSMYCHFLISLQFSLTFIVNEPHICYCFARK